MEDAAGLAELRALGARSVPIVSKGGKFVFAQLIQEVVTFLGIDEDVSPMLSPAELVARGDQIWKSAVRYVGQMPDGSLEKQLPNRPRSFKVLMHHLFQVPTAFLEARAAGGSLEYERLVAAPSEWIKTSADIAVFGEQLRLDFANWVAAEGDGLGQGRMPTYYGEQPAHEVLERTVWHSTQHVRQIMSLLQQEGVVVDAPLQSSDFEGLPLPGSVWDS